MVILVRSEGQSQLDQGNIYVVILVQKRRRRRAVERHAAAALPGHKHAGRAPVLLLRGRRRGPRGQRVGAREGLHAHDVRLVVMLEVCDEQTETCNTMWYPSTCAAMGLADVRAGTQMIVPPPPL